ncbi:MULTISPECIES: acetyl-CoA carboxylase biotin carboxyl carrier protein subunit [unclassified Bradyrhizobium]|uniref:acetyl-CoA carboxylase biotin carboxyl carrier protein subunit n=1 Tax=unclassified Bradyrhizobium TaxID=2631580 RepID=UPI0023058651|nr:MULTISPECIES: acetyl-CoA carboxylase biotin carboxyl carrier protein subunit [unclassified Bradyrhizobium]MDA9451169.1 biotin attachment protein [Bradyrhizobium sp. CCBAU 21360]MDA9457548.1 biotin attachment protein [Bradyrhizobium sp. CCBAU 21359]
MPEYPIATEIAGRVINFEVALGDPVIVGQEVALVEAMKMEIPVTASASGTISRVLVKLDEMVAEGQVIMTVTG